MNRPKQRPRDRPPDPPEDLLLAVAAAIADGKTIDWNAWMEDEPELASALDRLRRIESIRAACLRSGLEDGESS